MEKLALLGGPVAVQIPPGDLFKWPIITEEDEQAMLEVQNLSKRATMLLSDLTNENDRLDLIKQALGGKQDDDLGFN